MILPDVSVLVHAYNADSAVFHRARDWWRGCLGGTQGVGLPWVSILGFVRITTHRSILRNPLPVSEVTALVDGWLELPHVHIPEPSTRHFGSLRAHLEGLGIAGNLTTDAHLATLAIERGYVLYSTETDFARFAGLRWVNPCAGK